MRRLFVAVGSCGLAFGMACSAAEPTVPPPPAAIQTLVEQLGAERYADRETATRALEKIGTPALKALQAAALGDNPEVRERAGALVTKLKRLGDSGSRLTTRRVKLDYKDMPLGTALNDLRTRTGLNLSLDPNRVANTLRRVTCQTAELPAWEALDAFCAAAGLRESFLLELDVPKSSAPRRGYVAPPRQPNPDAVPVVLIDGKPQKLPGDRSTAVRVLALPPTFPGHRTTLGTGEVTFCFDVTPAPGLGWQDVAGVKVSRLIDSSGRSGGAGVEKNSSPDTDMGGVVVFARPGMAMRFDMRGEPIYPDSFPNPRVLPVPLKLGNPAARTIKRLEGSVFGEIQVENQPLVVVDEPKKNAGVWYNGPGELRFSVLELKEPRGPGGLGSIRVQLESPSIWAVNARKRVWNPGWPEAPMRPGSGNRVEARDAAGKPFPVTSSGITDMSDDGMITIQTVQMSFRSGVGLPAKLVVVGPKTVTVEVPFVMEDVRLP